MKKMIIVLAAGIITTAAMAQENNKAVPPPPPPPADLTEMPAPPPPPPPAPLPPEPPKVMAKVHQVDASNANDKGYVIRVMKGKEENIILVSKNGVTQKIRMSVWNAKPQYFRNKYGELPPPPPPPPAPPAPPSPPVKD
ncbi:MAG: hypothetical protein U0V75_11195 [Ferruginibacter sp.]